MLPSSNGRGAIAWDASTWRITQFLEHAYQNPTPTTSSRQFVYDSYPGVRVGTSGTWLSSVAPESIAYLPGTGIIHAVRSLSGYALDEYEFAPMGLGENASVMVLQVTNASASAAIDAYSIFNYQVGSAVSGSAMPGADNGTSPTTHRTARTMRRDPVRLRSRSSRSRRRRAPRVLAEQPLRSLEQRRQPDERSTGTGAPTTDTWPVQTSLGVPAVGSS